MKRTAIVYQTDAGVEPYAEYLGSLRDRQAVSKIRIRVNRAELGNLGDHRSVGPVSYTHLDVYKRQEVGDDSEIREGAGVGADPVGKGLGQRGLDVGEGGGAPDGDEELGEGHFAGPGIGDEESVCVIDEEFVTALVGLPHDKVEAGAPVVVSSTEGGVEISVGMLRFVFDPELVESQIQPFVVL